LSNRRSSSSPAGSPLGGAPAPRPLSAFRPPLRPLASFVCQHLVDLVIHYSNLTEQGELLKECLEMVPKGPYLGAPPPYQFHQRLPVDEIDALANAYLSGATVKELADQFQIHRTTVSEILTRNDVPRRQLGLTPEQIGQAAKLYGEGWSLKGLGDHFGCNAGTVRTMLKREGIEIRKRRGWNAQGCES
jgi:transposase